MKIEADIKEVKDAPYTDWDSAFEVACRDLIRNATPWDKSVSIMAASNKDVKRVIATVNGENDGANWVGVFEMNDGRFVAISSGCDYTGWGCQDGGEMMVAKSEEDILRYGLKDDERERLGVILPTAAPSSAAPDSGRKDR